MAFPLAQLGAALVASISVDHPLQEMVGGEQTIFRVLGNILKQALVGVLNDESF